MAHLAFENALDAVSKAHGANGLDNFKSGRIDATGIVGGLPQLVRHDPVGQRVTPAFCCGHDGGIKTLEGLPVVVRPAQISVLVFRKHHLGTQPRNIGLATVGIGIVNQQTLTGYSRITASVHIRGSIVLGTANQLAIPAHAKGVELVGAVVVVALRPGVAVVGGFENAAVVSDVGRIGVLGVKHHFVVVCMQVKWIATSAKTRCSRNLAPAHCLLPIPNGYTTQPNVIGVFGGNSEEEVVLPLAPT